MKGRVGVLVTIVVALGAAGFVIGILAKSGSGNQERAPGAPTESSTAVPTADTTSVDEQHEMKKIERHVRARAEKYIAAINAKDEAAAAPFTCGKTGASLLWVVAAGRKITLLDVEVGGYIGPYPAAGAAIRIDGRPSSPSIVFVLKDGEWCVYP